MLELLCLECSIVKIAPPPVLVSRVCIRVFCKTTSIAWNIRCKKNVLGGYCVIFFGEKLILLSCDVYVCIAYIDVPKVHLQTIYCGKFTVEETWHSAWAMFRQHDSWIVSNIIFEAHPESWRNAVTYILQLCIQN